MFHWKVRCRILLHYVLYKAPYLSCTHYQVPILLLPCCVLWSTNEFLTNSSLHLINTFPSPFHAPIFQPWGTVSGVEELEILISCMWFSILSASPSQWVCSRSLVGIASPNPAGGMDVCLCECYVLSRRGPCVGLNTRPNESHLVCEWAWAWLCILDSDEALAHYGL